MTHVLCPGNPPSPPRRPAAPPARTRARALQAGRRPAAAPRPGPGAPPLAPRAPGPARALAARAFGTPLAAALLAACAPTLPALPPAPRTFFSPYAIGADDDRPPAPPGDEYGDVFGFRERDRPARPGDDPWPPGHSLREGAFNPHRRAEPGAPPAPRRGPAAP